RHPLRADRGDLHRRPGEGLAGGEAPRRRDDLRQQLLPPGAPGGPVRRHEGERLRPRELARVAARGHPGEGRADPHGRRTAAEVAGRGAGPGLSAAETEPGMGAAVDAHLHVIVPELLRAGEPWRPKVRRAEDGGYVVELEGRAIRSIVEECVEIEAI